MWTKENIPDLTGKIAIVTGANTGVGFETAFALFEAGAKVILACRNLESAQQAITKMQEQKGRGNLEPALLDLSSLDSVKQFAADFGQKYFRLDILINNAGVMMAPAEKTAEGFELQFGVNFLGHFALTGHLFPLLAATPASRVVTVSSLAYTRGAIDFNNLRLEKSYDPVAAYAQSKLANLLFAIELQRRIVLSGDRVTSVCAQPGANKTDLARHMSSEAYTEALQRFGTLMDPWQGALPSLYAAVSDQVVGGALYGPDQDGGVRGFPARANIETHALDELLARQLWNYAEEVTGIRFPETRNQV